jgi:hypothetical protein
MTFWVLRFQLVRLKHLSERAQFHTQVDQWEEMQMSGKCSENTCDGYYNIGRCTSSWNFSHAQLPVIWATSDAGFWLNSFRLVCHPLGGLTTMETLTGVPH